MVSVFLALAPWIRGERAGQIEEPVSAAAPVEEIALAPPVVPPEEIALAPPVVSADTDDAASAATGRAAVPWAIPDVGKARLAALSDSDSPDEEVDLLAGMAAPDPLPSKESEVTRLASSEANGAQSTGLAVLADAAARDEPGLASGSSLRDDIVRMLRSHGIRGFKVSVSPDHVVTLKGASASLRKKRKALALVRARRGVTRVRDKIFVYQQTRQKLLSLK